MLDHDRIQQALDILEAEGRKAYQPEAQAELPAYEAIGRAIAEVNNSGENFLRLAYAGLEDWNYHDLCAVIEWAYPLFGQSWHASDLERLQRRINREGVTIKTDWDTTK